MMDMTEIGEEVRVKGLYAQPSHGVWKAQVLGRWEASLLELRVHHNTVEGEEKKSMVWSSITKGLEYQGVAFIDSQNLLKFFGGIFFFFLHF